MKPTPSNDWPIRKLMGPLLRSIGLGALVTRVILSHAADLPSAVDRPVDFERDIRPIFQARCLECHGADKQRGGLRLESRSFLLKGGENHGPAVVPGKGADSVLLRAVAGQIPDLQMPPKGERLTPSEMALVRAWIDQGAVWPGGQVHQHWALRPVIQPAVPRTPVDLPEPSTPVDAFLLSSLGEARLAMNPRAERRVLIRRMYQVVLGLQPSDSEVEAFVRDPRPRAVELMVDRILSNPRYGERWGRHWLDVVRYADSNGFETNRERKTAYPYRDYVIRCFNEDVPYDRFVREQIAGDALGVDLGTGFLVAGAFDLVKSPDINLTLMQRQDELADIINTTGTAFLGLTLGCARCHDHKFDPVSQKDYYALQAVFAGVGFGDRTLQVSLAPKQEMELVRVRNEVASARKEIDALRARQERAVSTKSTRPPVSAGLNVEEFPAQEVMGVRFQIHASSSSSEPGIDELEIFDTRGINVALAGPGVRVSASGTLPGYAIHKLEHLNDGHPGNQHSWISDTPGRGWVKIEFSTPHKIQRIVWSRDRGGQFKDRIATDYVIEGSWDRDIWKPLASSADRKPLVSEDPNAFITQLSPEDQIRARGLLEVVQGGQDRIQQLTSGPSVWLGTFSQPTNVHRLYRGEPLQPREVVGPDAVAVLGSLGLKADAPERERRLRLAEWLTRPDNPLVTRVLVNRVWHYLFGTGLVDTPSDFGANGGRPTHPELLDWLADDFVRNGWSIKRLQRQILLSRAFQQSSSPRDDGLRADAGARLLWRFPPRRLEAEAIRDSILAASGALDLRMGGPGFHLQIVEEDNVYRYFPRESFGQPEFRRMVYLARIRQEQDSVFGSFDCPSGNQVISRRTRSNTPLQALNLFNSTFVLQQADLLAERLRIEAGPEPVRQVDLAFRHAFGRVPDRLEQEASVALVNQSGLPALCRALFNTSEFLFVF